MTSLCDDFYLTPEQMSRPYSEWWEVANALNECEGKAPKERKEREREVIIGLIKKECKS